MNNQTLERRLKQAAFPEHKTLDEFDIAKQKTLGKKQLKQLRELQWLEQAYNIILLAPPGVGKTFIATGLGLDAVHSGYKVIFITMGDLVHVLKTQEITRSSKTKLKRIIALVPLSIPVSLAIALSDLPSLKAEIIICCFWLNRILPPQMLSTKVF